MRVYIDTSVIGGIFDIEFAEPTDAFFAKVASGDVVMVVSDLLHTELVRAPDRVREYLTRRSY
jgi:predicted nucleic acid-binding protein